MRSQTIFVAATATATVPAVAGGTSALPNPAAGTSATALLVINLGASNASIRFAADASYAPRTLDPGLADYSISPFGQLLLTDAVRLAAPYVIAAGTIGLQAGTMAASINVNS